MLCSLLTSSRPLHFLSLSVAVAGEEGDYSQASACAAARVAAGKQRRDERRIPGRPEPGATTRPCGRRPPRSPSGQKDGFGPLPSTPHVGFDGCAATTAQRTAQRRAFAPPVLPDHARAPYH